MSDVDSLKSWSSAGITSTQSCSESSEYRGQGRRPLAAVGINTQGILDCQFDAIINRYLGTSEYVTKTVSAAEVMDGKSCL